MIISSNSLSRGSGMPHQVDDAIVHAMSGTELSRVRTELRLLPPEPINQRLLASRGADIVMQSSADLRFHLSDYPTYRELTSETSSTVRVGVIDSSFSE